MVSELFQPNMGVIAGRLGTKICMNNPGIKSKAFIKKTTGIVLLLALILISVSGKAQNIKNTQRIGKGDTIPDLVMKNLDGEKVSLQSLRGKLVLVYFWASWCKPCRKTIPSYIKLYRKYKNAAFADGEEGFVIYSISLDKNKAAWKKASGQHGIPWNSNVSDLKRWQSEAVEKYGIASIPRSFLVNGEGVIEAVDVKDDLAAILEEKKK